MKTKIGQMIEEVLASGNFASNEIVEKVLDKRLGLSFFGRMCLTIHAISCSLSISGSAFLSS